MTTFRVSRPFFEFLGERERGVGPENISGSMFSEKTFLFPSPFDEMLLKCCRDVAETLLFVVGYSHVLFLTFHIFL